MATHATPRPAATPPAPLDQGDCRDIRVLLDGALRGIGGAERAAVGGAAAAFDNFGPGAKVRAALRDPSVLREKLGAIVATQGGYVQSGMLVGVGLGLLLALCGVSLLCHLRRKARQIQNRNRVYTPYGQADSDFGEANPRLASAVDDDDDDDDYTRCIATRPSSQPRRCQQANLMILIEEAGRMLKREMVVLTLYVQQQTLYLCACAVMAMPADDAALHDRLLRSVLRSTRTSGRDAFVC